MNVIIQKFFNEIASTYDLTNRLVTFGLDVHWRRAAARIAADSSAGPWLDVCCGTGDMTRELSGLAGPGTRIFGADFSKPMLDIALRKSYRNPVRFALTDAGMLPFPDGAFDRVTLAFATRNLNSDRETLVRTFREFRRVLRPGGRFVNLETTGIRSRLLRTLVRIYLEGFVRRLGGRISGSKPAYAYLAGSIGTFYTAGKLNEILLEAGFSSVTHRRLSPLVVAVHSAVK
jgi:demethylmenaquinone methyltransferase / 2-methoxy-6-polyprenyl-1,4-benzoquinol methylase